MTEKRFTIEIDDENFAHILDNGTDIGQYNLCKLLNELADENEQLKQREETLLSEIEDFQELLTKNDSVCHKRVIDLIDDRISNFSNVKAELLLYSDDDYRLEKLSFAIQNLRELKKELEE